MTAVAGSQGGLMLRADPTTAANPFETTPAVYAEMKGRTMNGLLRLDLSDVDTDVGLERWIYQAVSYISTLLPKQ